MKIYTKTGDKGKTGLIGGGRVWKDSSRIEAYGSVDELNSMLGLATSFISGKSDSTVTTFLNKIQNELFSLGCQLATPKRSSNDKLPKIADSEIKDLEKFIDNLDKNLPPLHQFILPSGNSLTAAIHLARSICRRTERRCVQLSKEETIDQAIIIYLNRLSDTLFVLARWIQHQSGIVEIPWEKGNRSH